MNLRAEHLKKTFGSRTVVSDVSFCVNPGEIVGLLGPNGAGKTTSFRMTAGLILPDVGRIFLGDEDLSRLPLHQRARRGLGYLPQEASIFRKLTVEENFLAVFEGLPKLTRADREHQMNTLIEEFSLQKVRTSLGESLSGGERRRVEIARSLIPKPKFILFDEPFAGVDPIAVDDLQKQIFLLKEKGFGVLITDHAVRETLGICDRAYILVSGSIIEQGTPQELAANPRARQLYLGEHFQLIQK